jgi:hydroxyacylglutathione hydrolase
LRIETITTGPFMVNTFLVYDEVSSEGFVVDPGEGVDAICKAIDRLGMKPKAIINTHAHIDHIQGVMGVRDRYDLPFYLHPADRPVLARAEQSALMFGIRFEGTPEPDHDLAEGDVLEAGAVKLTTLHTPGHCPGHVVFVSEGHALVGDVLFDGSIGRTDLPGGDHATLIQSIKERLLPLDDETAVHCGHGPNTSIGRERRTNPFLTEDGLGKPLV